MSLTFLLYLFSACCSVTLIHPYKCLSKNMCNNDEVVNNLSDFFFFFAEDFWDKTLLLEMNFTESMNVVHNRIQQLEPENASKIIGYLLLMQEHGDRDMIRLAFCPDSVMRSMINFVKCELAKDPRYYSPPSDHLPIRSSFGSFTGSSIQPPSASVSPPLRIGSWENSTEVDSLQFLNFDESMTSPEFSSGFFSRDHQCLPLRTSRRSPSSRCSTRWTPKRLPSRNSLLCERGRCSGGASARRCDGHAGHPPSSLPPVGPRLPVLTSRPAQVQRALPRRR